MVIVTVGIVLSSSVMIVMTDVSFSSMLLWFALMIFITMSGLFSTFLLLLIFPHNFPTTVPDPLSLSLFVY